MAGNNSIQLLRGNDLNTKTTVLLEGQPAYDIKNNKLYIGNGTTALNSLTPINPESGGGGSTSSTRIYRHNIEITLKTSTGERLPEGTVFFNFYSTKSTTATNLATLYDLTKSWYIVASGVIQPDYEFGDETKCLVLAVENVMEFLAIMYTNFNGDVNMVEWYDSNLRVLDHIVATYV